MLGVRRDLVDAGHTTDSKGLWTAGLFKLLSARLRGKACATAAALVFFQGSFMLSSAAPQRDECDEDTVGS
jgi:hypothetical protein